MRINVTQMLQETAATAMTKIKVENKDLTSVHATDGQAAGAAVLTCFLDQAVDPNQSLAV